MTDDSTPKPHKYRTAPLPSKGLPSGIPYIVGNEAAERFSYYGMRCILTVFMVRYLHLMIDDPNAIAMSPAAATEHFHTFAGFVYFTPILGALLSDGILGKYLTVLLLSLVYCLGHLCLALMGMGGIPPAWWLFCGLALITLGSGGIKPCVSANVGDQFGHSNRHWISKVYSIFYFSINVGSFTSTMLTPWVLEWYGPHWAFGVPGVLMALATLVFWMGRYKFVHIPPGGLHFLREVFSPVGINALLKLSIVFAFFVVFFALYDQTGSTWVLQAADLNRDWMGIQWLASQIQAVNPILVLVLIPMFTFGIYPAVSRVYELTPIRKISIGLFLMIGGFAIVALLQEAIDRGQQPSVGWQILAYVILTASEVMVSITGLEFAYTQAPRSMKSVVMAFFFCSIAFGNFFTMGVNHFIQVPDQVVAVQQAHEAWYDDDETARLTDTEKIRQIVSSTHDAFGNGIRYSAGEDGHHIYGLAGLDGQLGTSDDVSVFYDNQGIRYDTQTSESQLLTEAAKLVEEHFFAHDESLPNTETGAAMLADRNDSWGTPLRYRLVNRNTFRIISLGADREYLTPADVVLTGSVTRVTDGDDRTDRPLTWRERRLAELGRDEEPTDDATPAQTSISTAVTIGGLTKLEGAPYYWFWTGLMAATAVLFVLVALFYQPKEYLQEEH